MKVPGSLVGGHSGARCLTTPENVGDGGVWKVGLPWSEEGFLMWLIKMVTLSMGHPCYHTESSAQCVAGDGRTGQDCAEIGKHRR